MSRRSIELTKNKNDENKRRAAGFSWSEPGLMLCGFPPPFTLLLPPNKENVIFWFALSQMFGTYVRNYKGKAIVPYGDCTGDHLSSSVMPKFGTNYVGRETSKRRRPWRELERESKGSPQRRPRHQTGTYVRRSVGKWENPQGEVSFLCLRSPCGVFIG